MSHRETCEGTIDLRTVTCSSVPSLAYPLEEAYASVYNRHSDRARLEKEVSCIEKLWVVRDGMERRPGMFETADDCRCGVPIDDKL